MKKIFCTFLMFFTFLFINAPAFAEPVMFNTATLKYHKLYCKWAKKCTVNCVKIDKSQAIKRGGKPCKVCGG